MRSISATVALAAALTALVAPAAQGALPDGRAYEMITPPDVANKMPLQGAGVSDDGTRVVFRWDGPLPMATNGFFYGEPYVAQRGAAGWQIDEVSVVPPGAFGPEISFVDVNTQAGVLNTVSRAYGVDYGIWRRELDGTMTPLLTLPAPGPYQFPPGASVAGASADFSHIFFMSTAALLPGALVGTHDAEVSNLYEITGKTLRLAGILPDGSPTGAYAGSPVATSEPSQPDAVSRDGRTIFFGNVDTWGSVRSVYARVDGTQTVRVSASQRTVADPVGQQHADFVGASDDGRRALFTSTEELTDDAATAGDSAQELYEYDLDGGTLRTLTPGFGAGVAPRVLGLMALSRDARRVYFVAQAALPGSDAVDGAPNLYRIDTVTNDVRFIATLIQGGAGEGDYTDWMPGERYGNNVATDDARRLAFLSEAGLTGPENVDSDGSTRHTAVYLYDDDSGALRCVSCGSPGTHATGDAGFSLGTTVPGIAIPAISGRVQFTRARSLSQDGRRVFFDSPDALVPEDVNGRYDVYEYEDGHVYLISPGRGPHDAYFMGSSASGDDVLFSTDQPLTPADRDPLGDLYDARVGGGFPAPPPAPAPCSGDACQGTPRQASTAPVAASITFFGPATTDEPGKPVASRPAKVSVTRKTTRGTSLMLTVRVPAAGRLTVTGRLVRRVRRSVTRAGSYRLRVLLSPAARRTLARHGRLRVPLRVGYLPSRGAASSTTVTATVKG
jgi:hypothetical protein